LQGVDRTWSVRPQRWSEKCRLARFAAWGEAFVRQQLCNMCVRPEPVESAPDEQDALVALAAWLSAGGSQNDAGLPLDSAALTRVALTVCRELGVGPAVLDALPVYEVESMWRQIPNAMEEDTTLPASSSPAEMFTHRIEVIPDSPAVALPDARREGNADLSVVPTAAAPGPTDRMKDRSPAAAAGKPGTAVAAHEEKASSPSVAPVVAPMTGDRGGRSEEQLTGSVHKPADAVSAVSRPAGQAGGDGSLNAPHATSLRASGSPEFLAERRFGRQPAKSRFRVMMPAVRDRAVELPLAAPQPSITQHPPITTVQNDSTSVAAPVMPWVTRQQPMQAPFAPPVAPAALSSSFDDFAAEFGEGLQVAATELGILEER
jgi:hypothetical protein